MKINFNDEVKLTLFSRTGRKYYKIEQFNFRRVSEKVSQPILNSTKEYLANLDDYDKKDYNFIVEEKGKKTIEYFDFHHLYESSSLFKVFLELLIKNSLPPKFFENYNIDHDLKTRRKDMDRLSFYVIQIKNENATKYFFKRFSLNNLYLRKNVVLKVRDANRLSNIEDTYLNLDTNFDFYFEIPNKIINKDGALKDYRGRIYIKYSDAFETILNFRKVYDEHRDIVLNKLQELEIVENIEQYLKEFKYAKFRRKYMRIEDEKMIKKALKDFDEEIIKKFEGQTDAIEIDKINGEIKFKINSSDGVDILLDILGEHVLRGFDDSLQQVLSRTPIE